MIASRRRRTRWLVSILAGFGLLVAVGLLWPVHGGDPMSPGSWCISNVKQLTLGEIMYAADHDDRLPPATSWMDAITPDVKSKDTFHCPGIKDRKPDQYGYAMDFTMSAKKTAAYPKPENTALLFDSVLLARNATSGFYGFPNPPRHRKNNVSFLDGHVKAYLPGTEAK